LRVIDLVQDLGAVPVTVDAVEHDQVLAAVSHVPQLLALALAQATLDGDAGHGLAAQLAGPGFRDMTRIAASDYRVWRGVVETNRAAILAALERVQGTLAELGRALEQGELEPVWARASDARRALDQNPRGSDRRTDLRGRIDRCDERLLRNLSERLRAVGEMGRLKRGTDAPVRDPDRERRLLAERQRWGRALDLPADLVEQLFEAILDQSREIQQRKRAS
jgi:chorismate mutase